MSAYIEAMYEVPGSRLREMTDTIARLRAQVERDRPVIDAAVNWVLACDSGVLGAERPTLDALDAAVRSRAPDEVNEAET